jgi:hypothetical protein
MRRDAAAACPFRLVTVRQPDTFLYTLKAGPAGGRLRRPSSRRQRHDGHLGTGLTFQTEES